MHITNNNIDSLSGATLDPPESADTTRGTSGTGTGTVFDSVNLQGAGALLSLAKANTPSTSSAKLQSLQALIRSGQYDTDTGQLSSAVIQGHLRG